MADRFTGFYEARGFDVDEVSTTVTYLPVDELLERLRARLLGLPPGACVRIDLIAWGEDSE